MSTMSTWVLSIKVFLISAGFMALAMGIKFFIPIAVNEIPAMWSMLLSWLKPPYLYIIINGIIITIAASSRFHHGRQSEPSEHLISVKTPPPSVIASLSASDQPPMRTIIEKSTTETEVPEIEDRVVELKPVMVNGSTVRTGTEEDEEEAMAEGDGEGDDRFDESSFMSNTLLPPEIPLESLLRVREKPLALSRFSHRKPIRTNPEGVKALRVAKPKRHDTLESTWKMITEGRHVPLTRHLKKSDTFEHRHVTPAVDHVPKSATFKDRSHNESPPIPKVRKEPSLGQDELNRRVEAFIKKINDDMRMQRQESINQYMEMINRGV